MIVQQTSSFIRSTKKLHTNEKQVLDDIVRGIMESPEVGQKKVGDLSSVRVCKFKIHQTTYRLAYTVEEDLITLLYFGARQNFYRDLKR